MNQPKDTHDETQCSEGELVCKLLERFNRGDFEAREELFRLVAAELHSLARREMRTQPPGHTLQATALVHEAYLKLFGREAISCHDKSHLLRAAAQAMRQVLHDHARAKWTQKRGGHGPRVELDSGVGAEPSTASFLEFMDEIERLSSVSPDMARAMELRYILGFSIEEIAEALCIPLRSFERAFRSAEALLAARLR